MLRYGLGRTVSTTTTTKEDSPELNSERRIRRLRLTLHAGENGKKEQKNANSDTAEKEKVVNGAWKKKNGLIQRERPAGRESPEQHHGDITNGVPENSLQHHGPKVYGVVQRTGSDRQQEVMAREWTVSHLQDEMKYIREVRDSLEKVRERMYGQFGGMQQSVQRLSQEIRTANSNRRSLEAEVKIRTAAMDSFDQMNSSLISANLDLQKSLLENCRNRVDMREELKSLRSTCEKTETKLKDKERQLASVQAENQTLRLQVETSPESGKQALQELKARLEREHEEKLLEEQRKHREEIEKLQAQIDEYIRRLEEAERNIRTAAAKIAERDQRIIEVERLLDCMGKEKSHLLMKLQACEQRLRMIEQTDQTDATVTKRSKALEEEALDLRERIKHLNDMVFCQQRKVKGMIEEVESLRAQVAQKDMFISELLDRIAIVECENNELDDKLKYFMSTQNRPQHVVETREIGVGCDLLPRSDPPRHDVHFSTQSEPMQSATSPLPRLPIYLTTQTQQRTFRSNNPPPSRLEYSLLRYTPVEYSRQLQSSFPVYNSLLSNTQPSASETVNPGQSSTDEVDVAKNKDTKRQGQVGDLRHRSKEELHELLLRQEKILSNRRLLQTLPDKGKKTAEFVEKVHFAIERRGEEERKQSTLSDARTELQSKYQQAFTMQQRAIHNTPAPSQPHGQGEDAALDMIEERETFAVSAHIQEINSLDMQQELSVSRAAAGDTMETAAAGDSLDCDETKESDLVEALERVKLSDTASPGVSVESKELLNSTARDSYFLGKETPKKPHYLTVLEKTAVRKEKFKPNRLLHQSETCPLGSSSHSQSSGDSLLLSTQARKERDKKHLDDITAAKLPPLHHNPAQLLSLEESAILLKEQTKRQQELQAKQAAQKLSEGLRISMGSYAPDSGPVAAYREVHDEGAELSSEEDSEEGQSYGSQSDPSPEAVRLWTS
ncbi:hypothetical protein LDENG_00146780 [Lucifuga dentata]|nr:hypothetical protein LDENG_00146780 [Lucifuga dentata]